MDFLLDYLPVISIIVVFFGFLFLGVPVAYTLLASAFAGLVTAMPFDTVIKILAQRSIVGIDKYSLLCIPFFILAGTLMNRGGLAQRLINLAKLIGGPLPGTLAHVNVIANMLFGSLSGSAVAAAAAIGGTMTPMMEEEKYDMDFAAAVNIASCPTGLLIPPSNIFILYALVSGSVSIATLFVAGYLPGILMGLSVMIVSFFYAKKHKYPTGTRPTIKEVFFSLWNALPALFLIVIVIGGIAKGVFSATEASAIAVMYSLILGFIYRELKLKELPNIFLISAVTSSIVLFLVATSSAMSWAMTSQDIPSLIADALMGISTNPIIIMLLINILLLIVGMFMDMSPAVLIFTPIFLPIAQQIGIDPVHFGVILIFNLCIGICTPPVGSALFVGCSIAERKIEKVIRPLLPMFALQFAMLMVVTYVPSITLFLPKLFGMM